jgi:hypothetical protein
MYIYIRMLRYNFFLDIGPFTRLSLETLPEGRGAGRGIETVSTGSSHAPVTTGPLPSLHAEVELVENNLMKVNK